MTATSIIRNNRISSKVRSEIKMDFAEYKKLVDKYYEKDCREVNFQNRIIIPFL